MLGNAPVIMVVPVVTIVEAFGVLPPSFEIVLFCPSLAVSITAIPKTVTAAGIRILSESVVVIVPTFATVAPSTVLATTFPGESPFKADVPPLISPDSTVTVMCP